jgi:hypothetical protein
MLAIKATCYLTEVKKAGRDTQSEGGGGVVTEQWNYTSQTYVLWQLSNFRIQQQPRVIDTHSITRMEQ